MPMLRGDQRAEQECARQALLVQSAQLARSESRPEGVYLTPDPQDYLRWNGVIFVRKGAYATGVFRFSVQFGIENGSLSMPSVFFPPILLHPLVQPANGRLQLLVYNTLASSRNWATRPDQPSFLNNLLQMIAECFQDSLLDNVQDSYVLNQEMTQLYRTDRSLFLRLAQQSASLSITDTSLYDAESGSNVPGDAPITDVHSNHSSHVSSSTALSFTPISNTQTATIRSQFLI